MKKLILIVNIALLFCFPLFCFAEETGYEPPVRKVFIKYDRLSWQTYEFYAMTNPAQQDGLTYVWTIDNNEQYSSPTVRYFFDRGIHNIGVKVTDQYGNIKQDHVKLNISFWSLQNNWFWWMLYLLVILIILYYWIGKLIYLFNKRKMTKHVAHFFSFFDDHGWVERIVEEHVRKKQ